MQNPPQAPLSTEEMDAVYALPFTRRPHPSYKEPIPAIDEVKFSITSCRGCFGGCNFCALTFHQGRIVSSRSHESIISEVKTFLQKPNFKGYVHDVGGPTANFRLPACAKQLSSGTCADRSCIGFSRCGNLKVSHSEYVPYITIKSDYGYTPIAVYIAGSDGEDAIVSARDEKLTLFNGLRYRMPIKREED